MQKGSAVLKELDAETATLKALPAPGNHRARAGLAPALCMILQEVQRELGHGALEPGQALDSHALEQIISKVAERLGFELSSFERDEVLAELERDQKPFGPLQPLVDDPQISDIIVSDFGKVAIQQGRRNFSTDISFPSTEAYEAFVERLLQRAGTTYSNKKPIADGMIGGFARIHVVHRSLCETGPYLTIRLNRFASVSSNELLRAGLAPKGIFDYLQAIIRSGKTLMVAGEVGTGKTTLVRALASSLPEQEAILVIEDTPEIKLEHPHVRYVTTREANMEGAGRVSPSECIRGGMRMAMNRIIFGEIRDAEAAEAFIDVCASGHPGISTVHARSTLEAVARLELFLGRAQKGVDRSVGTEQIATAIQVLVHVDICKVTGRRRIMEVQEIGPVADGVLRHREIFRYQVNAGLPTWKVVSKVSTHREALEALDPPVQMNTLPNSLELDSNVLYAEVSNRARTA